MRFVVFGADQRLGAVHQDAYILDLLAAAGVDGVSPDVRSAFGSMLALIESGDRGLDVAAKLLDAFAGSDAPGVNIALSGTRLHCPFPGRRLALAGSNNAAHVAAYHTNHGVPTTADEVRARAKDAKAGGFWVVSPPVGPGAEIPIPRGAAEGFDYEGEVAIVLATGGKHLTTDDYPGQVWGTVLVIDWSIRAETLPMPWYGHKVFDSAKSIGPWISVGEVDPLACVVETRVNGEVRQRFVNGADMIHPYDMLLAQITKDLTLLPGDVLAGGTGPGTALDATRVQPGTPPSRDLYLKPGDAVEVSSPGLGTLTARVVAPDLAPHRDI